MNEAAAILRRLQEAFEVKTDAALAEILGVTGSAVSQWRKSGKVAADTVVTAARAKRLSLTWVFDGSGPMKTEREVHYRTGDKAPDPVREPTAFAEFLNEMTDKEIIETPEQIAELELRRLRLLAQASLETIERMEAVTQKK